MPNTSLCVFAARSKSMVMGEVSRGSCRSASPGLQEGALKAGWLKKQRSIMKNWQLRWFVLRSDQLYFYKDEEETKPQVRRTHKVMDSGGIKSKHYIYFHLWLFSGDRVGSRLCLVCQHKENVSLDQSLSNTNRLIFYSYF